MSGGGSLFLCFALLDAAMAHKWKEREPVWDLTLDTGFLLSATADWVDFFFAMDGVHGFTASVIFL
jgi:hypothetical protein